MARADPKAIAIAKLAVDALQQGYDADRLLGSLIPLLLAVATDYLGHDKVIAELERTIAEWRQDRTTQH